MTTLMRATLDELADAVLLARMMHAESPLHRDHDFDEAKVRELVCVAIASPDWLPLIAYQGGRPVGMALVVTTEMFFGRDKECTDLAFYVSPPARRGVVAHRLLRHVEYWAHQRDARRVMIGIHTGINDGDARAFFERSGYALTGTVMEKSVH